jgi:hypothetical protein
VAAGALSTGGAGAGTDLWATPTFGDGAIRRIDA